MCAMKKAGVLSILFVVVLLAVGVTAQAQQPKKVSRLGYLSNTDAATDSAQCHRPHSPCQGTRREAVGAAQRSGTQTFPCRGSLRSGQSGQLTRGERASPSRRACTKVDYSTLGDTSGGRLREGLRCAKQAAPGWTLRVRRGRDNAS